MNMNLLEHYVTNITYENKTNYNGIVMYELTCDIVCCGIKSKNENILIMEEDYNMVKEYGYYLA